MHLQGRRVVVVKTGEYTHYYLCHSTEQAQQRAVILCYEYRDDIFPLESRLAFLRLMERREYQVAYAHFQQNCDTVEITTEEFAEDEASVNQMEVFAEINLDIPAQIAELAAIVSATAQPGGDAFEADE